MHKAKAFFFACLGILCLFAAYHFGAVTAMAQAPSNPVVATQGAFSDFFVVTANGDVYRCVRNYPEQGWSWVSNVFGSSAPVSSQTMSMGQLKAKYATPAGGR